MRLDTALDTWLRRRQHARSHADFIGLLMVQRFSDRHGYQAPPAKIVVREDAPYELRHAIPLVARAAGMSPSQMRDAICDALLVAPDPDNWSEYPNVWDEVGRLMNDAPWYRVYDIVEVLYAELASTHQWNTSHHAAGQFQKRLNGFLAEKGIGWELRDGQITHRGSEVFAKSTQEVPDHLQNSGFQRAANELREALGDISRRPEPDVTGAVQHAMAALEATARSVTGQENATLGKLLGQIDLPSPLDKALEKLWGYASDRGRHIREQQTITAAEAELIVAVAGSVCAFLAQKAEGQAIKS